MPITAMLHSPPASEPCAAVVGRSTVFTHTSVGRWAPLLLMLASLQAFYLFHFYAPAHGGTDQNGYHVTARLLADGAHASFRPDTPFAFVGNMMVLTENGRVYAKYPPGYPLLAACARLVGGAEAMYLVNPICTVFACTMSFFLFRTILSEFGALLSVLWLSWNPLILAYSNDGNSHASTLLFVIVGAWGLISSLQNGSLQRGAAGAFCFGFAATIRYSEMLLFLPVLFAAAIELLCRGSRLRSRAARSAVILLAWAVPVACLGCFCWHAFGAPWKTGYSYCSEDSGFGWKYFFADPVRARPGNWEALLVQMNWMGLLILWPIGLVGLIAIGGVRWREGVFINLWILPSAALYLFYYWAPSGERSLGYLRFFITVIPALILCAIWLVERGLTGPPSRSGSALLLRNTGAIALGAVTALGVCVNLRNTLPSLEPSLAARQALVEATEFVRMRVPTGSNLFIGDEPLSNCIDAAGGFHLYNLSLFRNTSFAKLDRIMEDSAAATEPDPRQRARVELYWRLISAPGSSGDIIPRSNSQLIQIQDDLLLKMSAADEHIYCLLKTGQNLDLLPEPSRWKSTLVAQQVCYPDSCFTTFAIGAGDARARASIGNASLPNSVTWTLYQIQSR
jgi:hypothetical protein